MSWLRTWLRSLVMTNGERIVIELAAQATVNPSLARTRLLTALVRPDHLQLLAALEQPQRWQPNVPLTPSDVKAFQELLMSPLMLKFDVAMVNLAMDKAAKAVEATSGDSVRACGFAAGYRNSWEQFKALSTLTVTDDGKLGDTGDTAPSVLAQLNP